MNTRKNILLKKLCERATKDFERTLKFGAKERFINVWAPNRIKMLSIIIPTFNEGKYLPLLLDSIRPQDYTNYEIIVADAHSKDSTRKIARKYGCKVINGGLPAKGRNNGARHAKGELLLFLDADVILPPGFLKENIACFKEKKLVCAGVYSRPLSNLLADKLLFLFSNFANITLKKVQPTGIGWCTFITKRIFKEVGGYDEELLLGEDINLTKKTKKYHAFDILRKKSVYVSVRRMEKEGRLHYFLQCIKTTKNDFTGKRMTIKNKEVEYKFGGYEKLKVHAPPTKFK